MKRAQTYQWETLSFSTKAEEKGFVSASIRGRSTEPAKFDDFSIQLKSFYSAKLYQENHYYPFGMNMKGLESSDKQTQQNKKEHEFQFNAQTEREEIFGLFWDETPFRNYDMQLGRLWGVDKMADLYQAHTPFHFSFSNPIKFNDPTGLFPENFASTFVDEDGVIVDHRDDGDPFVYLVDDNWDGESKEDLPIIGFEDPTRTYKKGDFYIHYFPIGENDAEAIYAAAGVSTLALLADDATVIGVIDDLLIPVIWGGVLFYVALNVDGTYSIAMPIDDTSTADPDDQAVVVYIDGNSSPEAAQHGREAITSGILNFGVLDRSGTGARRRRNLRGIPTIPSKDRDEFPPSVLSPAGSVSVKHIDASDNRRAGQSIGIQLKPYSNGTKVIVIPINTN